jgi:hypothetical protein
MNFQPDQRGLLRAGGKLVRPSVVWTGMANKRPPGE